MSENQTEEPVNAPEILTAAKVDELFDASLFKEGENTDGAILTEGIVCRFGFHPDRVKGILPELVKLLDELPDEFQSTAKGEKMGGGYTFLNACLDKDGRQWGEHTHVEKLVCLGMANQLVEYTFPRSMWGALPGGLPYFVVKSPAEVLDVRK